MAFSIADGEYVHEAYLPGPGDRVLDIGANVGVFALWAARRGATVTAVEPAPDTVESLRENTSGSASISVVHAAAVAQRPPESTVRLFRHPEFSTRNTLAASEIWSGEALHDSFVVPAQTLDELLGDGVDLLKIDCEGAEFELVKGTTPAVLARAKKLILEFHREAGDLGELAAALSERGFCVEVLAGARSSDRFGIVGAIHARQSR